ncbi:MAG TPA: hypothetical protein PK031_04185 [Pseudomonadales bacterium]|nr:hypothetical protein [Pseudomonadales bacterium]
MKIGVEVSDWTGRKAVAPDVVHNTRRCCKKTSGNLCGSSEKKRMNRQYALDILPPSP